MSHRLQVLIPSDLDAQIDKEARRNRVSKGEWVRRALRESLRRGAKEGHADPVARMASLNGPAVGVRQMLAEINAGRN